MPSSPGSPARSCLLLRAEVPWNDGDRPGAIADIDRIRQNAGDLPSTSLTGGSPDADFVDELLYNRLYSLMWSQGTRRIDARRYDRLASLPIDRPGNSVYEQMRTGRRVRRPESDAAV